MFVFLYTRDFIHFSEVSFPVNLTQIRGWRQRVSVCRFSQTLIQFGVENSEENFRLGERMVEQEYEGMSLKEDWLFRPENSRKIDGRLFCVAKACARAHI